MQVICGLDVLVGKLPFPKLPRDVPTSLFLEGAYAKGVALPLQLTGCGILN